MTMTRTFQPVGQGLYCTEKFVNADGSKVNVVYDCGSLSLRHDDLESVIEASFDAGEDIDALFISHFDSDHVNGLPILLRHCNVRHVFLPLLTGPIEVAYWRLKSQADLRLKNGHELPVSYLLLDPQSRENNSWLIELGGSLDTSVTWLPESTTVLNSSFSSAIPGWCFVPFNYKRFDREADFRAVIDWVLGREHTAFNVDYFANHTAEAFAQLGADESGKLIGKINKKLREKLGGKAFKNRFGSINGNSMALYSGELAEENQPYVYVLKCDASVIDCEYRAGCLYFGDYEASDASAWNSLSLFYLREKCWNGIGCVQLPHHGSKHNYNTAFESMESCFVASYGLGNRNHHPGLSTIMGLNKHDRVVIHVTEANRYSDSNRTRMVVTKQTSSKPE